LTLVWYVLPGPPLFEFAIALLPWTIGLVSEFPAGAKRLSAVGNGLGAGAGGAPPDGTTAGTSRGAIVVGTIFGITGAGAGCAGGSGVVGATVVGAPGASAGTASSGTPGTTGLIDVFGIISPGTAIVTFGAGAIPIVTALFGKFNGTSLLRGVSS